MCRQRKDNEKSKVILKLHSKFGLSLGWLKTKQTDKTKTKTQTNCYHHQKKKKIQKLNPSEENTYPFV